jgi:hypothetical protein
MPTGREIPRVQTFELKNGQVRAWIEQGQSFCLKAVTREGDPVELWEDQLDSLIEGLQGLKAELARLEGRTGDASEPEGA